MGSYRIGARIAIYSGLILFSLWTLFPLFITLSTSFGPNLAPLSSASPFLSSFSFDNYIYVWNETSMPVFLRNTVIISLTSTFLSIAFGVPAAYTFARFRFRGGALLSRWILSMRLVPPVAFVVPFFVMFLSLHLLNTHISLIIVYTAFLLPFSIWLLTSFIREVPVEAEEAALVDGLNRFQVVGKIILPQIWPAIGVVAMLNMIAAWNEFLFALVLAGTGAATLPVGIVNFIGDRGIEWGQISAAAVITMIVPLVIGITINRYLLRGFTLGATK
jgi:multiple sugar transport system permease protein